MFKFVPIFLFKALIGIGLGVIVPSLFLIGAVLYMNRTRDKSNLHPKTNPENNPELHHQATFTNFAAQLHDDDSFEEPSNNIYDEIDVAKENNRASFVTGNVCNEIQSDVPDDFEQGSTSFSRGY